MLNNKQPSKKIVRLSLIILSLLISSSLKAEQKTIKNIQSTSFWNQHFKSTKAVKYPIIFVHGINATLADWEKTVTLVSSSNYCTMSYQKEKNNWINKQGNKQCFIWNIRYYEPNLIKEILIGNLSTYANRLDSMITLIKQISQQDKVVIIAHSMGGLVARAYMILNEQSWNSVHKILTVGTPNEGVPIAPPIINHWRDLHKKSNFITTLNTAWQEKLNLGYKQWGVVGAINLNNPLSNKIITGNSTDSGGLGYIQLSSAIPFNEWQEAIKNTIDIEQTNTTHFGYRVYTNNTHDGLLFDKTVLKAIIWATSQ